MATNDLELQLSAYLDGELTPSQTERLEQLLAQDPQARKQLDQLRQVAHLVGSLPHAQAPKSLREQILNQIERDSLLGPADSHSEILGRNHLRLRRFIAAAAMIALAAATAAIIYTIVSRTPTHSHQPVLAFDTPPAATLSTSPSAEEPALAAANHLTTGIAQATEAAKPIYSKIKLRLATDDLSADTARIHSLLAGNHIEPVVSTPLDQNRRQLAFLCSIDQLRNLFGSIQLFLGRPLDLLVTDIHTHQETVIQAVSEFQLLTIAAEIDSQQQFAHAQRFTPHLPFWYRDLFASGQSPDSPPTRGLRALGPIDQNTLAPQAPREILQPNFFPYLPPTEPPTPSARNTISSLPESIDINQTKPTQKPTPPATLTAVTFILQATPFHNAPSQPPPPTITPPQPQNTPSPPPSTGNPLPPITTHEAP